MKIILLKQHNILKIAAFNDSKIIRFIINMLGKQICFDKENNAVKINYSNLSIKLFNLKKLNELLFSINNYYFSKIKFKGKGFRLKIKKTKKICKFLFGHSHIIITYLKNIKIIKCNKYKYILKSVNQKMLKTITNRTVNIKPTNVYTNRGIRIGRQTIFKRKGKKGSYT